MSLRTLSPPLALSDMFSCLNMKAQINNSFKAQLFLILLTILFPRLVTASLKACEVGLTPQGDSHYTRDFPIEKYYSRPSAKAFALWRQRSPTNFRDSAFDWHFFDDAQKLKAAGFGSIRIKIMSERTPRTLPSPSSTPAERRLNFLRRNRYVLGTYSFANVLKLPQGIGPHDLAIKKYGSVENMFKLLRIDPRVTRNKYQYFFDNLNHFRNYPLRLFIDSKGVAYAISVEEEGAICRALPELKLKGLHHELIADLLFHRSSGEVDLYAAGYLGASYTDQVITSNFIEFKNQKTLNPTNYIRKYFDF